MQELRYAFRTLIALRIQCRRPNQHKTILDKKEYAKKLGDVAGFKPLFEIAIEKQKSGWSTELFLERHLVEKTYHFYFFMFKTDTSVAT